jgi:hypothetical protein
VRGSVLAALVTLLTATGHVAGGGSLVDLSPLAVLVPLLAQVLVAVAGRCRGAVGLLVVLGGGQVTLHYLLLVLTAHGTAAGTFSGTAMITAHAVATLATAVTLAHADGAVAALLTALARTVRRRPPVAPVAVAPPARPVPDEAVPLAASLVALAAHARRGPPTGC